jgi:hypothetical protein
LLSEQEHRLVDIRITNPDTGLKGPLQLQLADYQALKHLFFNQVHGGQVAALLANSFNDARNGNVQFTPEHDIVVYQCDDRIDLAAVLGVNGSCKQSCKQRDAGYPYRGAAKTSHKGLSPGFCQSVMCGL